MFATCAAMTTSAKNLYQVNKICLSHRGKGRKVFFKELFLYSNQKRYSYLLLSRHYMVFFSGSTNKKLQILPGMPICPVKSTIGIISLFWFHYRSYNLLYHLYFLQEFLLAAHKFSIPFAYLPLIADIYLFLQFSILSFHR